MDYALVSVYDKNNVIELVNYLANKMGIKVIASGGTFKHLQAAGVTVTEVSEITGFPEILSGRVKTLHPLVHGGILARDTQAHGDELEKHSIPNIKYVICNLYPFAEVLKKIESNPQAKSDANSHLEAIENIDIGGVTLIRAAAKNHEKVSVICDPNDYEWILKELTDCKAGGKSLSDASRLRLATKGFQLTAHYDNLISSYLSKQQTTTCSAENGMNGVHTESNVIDLKYGMNPHQKPASIRTLDGHALPIKVLNGVPGFVNLCDALNAWQLVRELRVALNLPAAASFKHVSPAGAAVGISLSEAEAKLCMVHDISAESLTPIAVAYARARGCDRLSSFGDFIALSDTCDESTAKLIKREVSDGVIAPGYSEKALEILKAKKNGGYLIFQMDSSYSPSSDVESRTLFGLQMQQQRNDTIVTPGFLSKLNPETTPANSTQLNCAALQDAVVATIALKYTQSNSVVFAKNGQTIGIGAGQQSRIHCTKLAGDKADNWWLRQHPKIDAALKLLKPKTKRPDIANVVDALITQGYPSGDQYGSWWQTYFTEEPQLLTKVDKEQWMKQLSGVVLSSDGFFPFSDCIYRAVESGTEYVISPGGSNNDASVSEACKEHNVTLLHTGLRLFHH